MNGHRDLATGNRIAAERPCGITSLIPTFGMSCRGRAEAFARRLQSRLRTLGSQTGESPTSEEDPIIDTTENPWLTQTQDGQQSVITSLQPLRSLSNEADSFFDFDCEPESPGSPAEECEYSRLIETASTTPQNDGAVESGYICSSPLTPETGSQSSQSSSDGPYFDPESSDADPRSMSNDYYDCIDNKKNDTIPNNISNGYCIPSSTTHMPNDSSDSASESLPPSQESTSTNATSGTLSSTFTGKSSPSNSTLQDIVLNELQQNSNDFPILHNGHNDDHEELEEAETTKLKLIIADEKIINDVSNLMVDPEPCEDSGLELQSSESKSSNEDKNENFNLSKQFDTDDDEDCRPQRVRRCSSLKTGKTPPGTPGRKKIVRFADVLGLDLADVKTFLDEIPTVPKSAYEDLEVAELAILAAATKVDKILMPLFQQPGGMATFLDIVREKQVSLENAAVTDPINMTITGSVRVRNLDFHKSVHIRYSLDNWRSYADLQANYSDNSCDGFSDKFTFTLFGNSMHVGQRMEFAVRFQAKGQQFWDNNYGSNYCFQCLPATSPARTAVVPSHATAIGSPTDGDWCRSFY